MSDNIRLNSLNRYKKESDRLVLEHHSAGCGGIVLRWRDPNDGIPISILHSAWLNVFIDGQNVSSRTILHPGEHQLAIHRVFDSKEPRSGLTRNPVEFYFGARVDIPERRDAIEALGSSSDWRILTNGTPDNNWKQLDFDDSNWEMMTEIEDDEDGRWIREYVGDFGARILQVPEEGELWIRHRFELEAL